MSVKEANSTCIICGKKYHLCIGCDRTKANWKSWKMITDSENCYKIYKVLNDYNYKKITKEEAQKMLNELDLSGLDTFKESVKEKIKAILKKKKNKKIKNFEKIENIVDTEKSDDICEVQNLQENVDFDNKVV